MSLEIKQSNNSKSLWSTKSSIIFAIFYLIIGVAIFIVAYLGMKHNGMLATFNQPVLDWMITHRKDQITEVMKVITQIGEPNIFIFITLAFAILWAIIKREIWRPFLLVSAFGVASVASKVIKIITENSRPPKTNMLATIETDFSFTSGHTVGITIFCLMVGYLICSRSSSVKGFIFWAISTVLAVGAMIISRLYLGHHWLTDTVGAIGLCLVIFAIFIFIDRIFIKITNR